MGNHYCRSLADFTPLFLKYHIAVDRGAILACGCHPLYDIIDAYSLISCNSQLKWPQNVKPEERSFRACGEVKKRVIRVPFNIYEFYKI
jgi:hypothetical protein